MPSSGSNRPVDVAIPIVFPDYLITVRTPAVEIDVPDWLPWVDDKVKIPKSLNRLPYLGHAGVLLYRGINGLSKYYEYGRYDQAALGVVKRITISDIRMGLNGKAKHSSLAKVLSEISKESGEGGRIEGAYIELNSGAFEKMMKYAEGRYANNNNSKRPKYELLTNSCLHFMREVCQAGGASMPTVADPRPTGYIERVRALHLDLDFVQTKSLTIQSITLPS